MKFMICSLLALAILGPTSASAKTITLAKGEILRGLEVRENDTITCGAGAAVTAPTPKAKPLCGGKETLMKQIGNCAVCMSNSEGSADYWVKINGASNGSMYTGLDDALEDLYQTARRRVCESN